MCSIILNLIRPVQSVFVVVVDFEFQKPSFSVHEQGFSLPLLEIDMRIFIELGETQSFEFRLRYGRTLIWFHFSDGKLNFSR